MYIRKPRPRLTKIWCEHCGKRLTDFEIMLGCLNCTGKQKVSPYVDKAVHEKIMRNENFLKLVAYEKDTSIALIRERVAKFDLELYEYMYRAFKKRELDKPRTGRKR